MSTLARRIASLAAALVATLAATPSGADRLVFRSGGSIDARSVERRGDLYVARLGSGEAQFLAKDILRIDEAPFPEAQSSPPAAIPTEALGAALPVAPRTEGDGAPDQNTSPSVQDIIGEIARKYAVPSSLVRAVARRESALNPRAVSPKGAEGVMQLMPATAKELGVFDSFDARENIEGGVRHFRRLLEKYDGRVAEALAAYNAGEGAVARHRGVPPYRETRQYIRAIVRDFERERQKERERERARSRAGAVARPVDAVR